MPSPAEFDRLSRRIKSLEARKTESPPDWPVPEWMTEHVDDVMAITNDLADRVGAQSHGLRENWRSEPEWQDRLPHNSAVALAELHVYWQYCESLEEAIAVAKPILLHWPPVATSAELVNRLWPDVDTSVPFEWKLDRDIPYSRRYRERFGSSPA